MGKFLNLGCNTLMFIMGQGCNLSCSYCLKHTLINEQLPVNVSPVIFEYLDFLAEEGTCPINCNYFGGEPLVYYDGVKSIVEHCNQIEQRLDKKIFHHSMISNGKSLNEEIVEFLNKNNFAYTISWDGNNSIETRGYDVIEDKFDLLLKINNLGISSVISSKSYPLDVVNAMQKFDDEYFAKNNSHVRCNFDDIMDTGVGVENQELCKIDPERFESDIQKIFDMYEEDVLSNQTLLNKYHVAIRYCMNNINSIKHYLKEGPNKISRCGQGLEVLNLDMSGKIYDCHNVTTGEIGHLQYDSIPFIRNIIASEYKTMHRINTICKDCQAISLCGGGCKYVEDERIGTSCMQSIIKFNVISDRLIKLAEKVGEASGC